MVETGFIADGAMMRTEQSAIENTAGVDRDGGAQAPVDGPRDLDHALSDLANRTARIAYFMPRDPAALPGAVRSWLRAVNTSFRFVDWNDPRVLLLPIETPLSMGTLLASAGLRGMAVQRLGA